MFARLIVLGALVASVIAHGNIASPTARGVGSNMKAVCGSVVEGLLSSDINTNQQQLEQNSAQQGGGYTDACTLYQCKGTVYVDNTANVQHFSAGQTIPIKVNIVAPHTGVANVSVVNTQTNQVIGSPLISWTDYASVSHSIPANNTEFSVTMPNVGSECTTAGVCVLQWWWDARSIDQTYMACIDFTQ